MPARGLAHLASDLGRDDTYGLRRIIAMGTGDPVLVIGAPALLLTFTLIACYIPARRSTQIDPMLALREE